MFVVDRLFPTIHRLIIEFTLLVLLLIGAYKIIRAEWPSQERFATFWQQAEIKARQKKTELLEILRLQINQDGNVERPGAVLSQDLRGTCWELLHPQVVGVARSRFE